MHKTFTNSLFFLIFLILFFADRATAQTITIGNVSGTYGQGSTIAVPFEVTNGCVPIKNTYSLYLSSNSGNFIAGPAVDTIKKFYATFFNYTIPATALPGTYKFMITASSPGNPTITSAASGSFTVSAVPGVQAGIVAPSINITFPEIFGACSGVANAQYTFTNSSTALATVNASFFNELSQVTEKSNVNLASPYTFTAKTSNYTILVTASSGGVIGTKAYQLINNKVNSTLGVSGTQAVCLDNGLDTLSYNIDLSASSGIADNYPGNVYIFNWGDNTPPNIYTTCQIQELGGIISHSFPHPSCGLNPNPSQPNSFEVDFQPESPYCGKIGTTTSSYAKVLSPPVNLITSSRTVACINSSVKFDNSSFPGEDPNSPSGSCTNVNALYTWTAEGVTYLNYKYKQPFYHTFTTRGLKVVTLHLQSNSSACPAKDTTFVICIQNPPQPKFAVKNAICAPTTITPTDQSVTDAGCGAPSTYVWTVTGPPGFSYAGGTNQNSRQPKLNFSHTGTYQVTLGIIGCDTITTLPQTVVVDSVPSAKLSPTITLCGANRLLTFGPTPGPTQTILNGNGTYLWTVTGSAGYSYQNGTTATSEYPQILFTDTATYTVTVSQTNGCGTGPATASQQITFKNAPTVVAGTYPTACPTSPIALTGTITGKIKGIQWISLGSGSFSSPTAAVTNYTPSGADIKAGSVKLVLEAQSTLPIPCDLITDTTTVSIYPPDSVTSAKKISVCSGAALNYAISASTAGSTFTWTVDAAHTTASASGYANGGGATINDKLNNSDTTYATVTYLITPVSKGCSGTPDTLAVTIAPKQPVAAFTQDINKGCGDLTVHFTNKSTPYNSAYSWTFGDGTSSTVTNPVHTFQAAFDGSDTTYTITLHLLSGCTTVPPVTTTITVSPLKPVAGIFPKAFSGCSPFRLTLNNLSADTNLSYTYYLYQSDGTTLVEDTTVFNRNPVTFRPIVTDNTQKYIVYMMAQGFCNNTDTTKHIFITVSSPSVHAAMQTNANAGCAPLSLTFTNLSVGGSNFYYTIYDSTKTPIGQPIIAGTADLPYTFLNAGTYFVSVSATNACNAIPITSILNQVAVFAVPKATFSADNTQACKNLDVNFTNLTPSTANTPAFSLSYEWDFGDNSPHFFGYNPPTHSYIAKNSPFTVKLIATNTATLCSDTTVQKALIKVSAPPYVNFTAKPDTIIDIPNYHFDFVDESTNSPVQWQWTFGDGGTSILENPGHTYAYGDTGIHKVTLIAYNKDGCDSVISHNVLITGVPGQLFMPNAFIPTSSTSAIKVFIAKGSGIRTWHMQIFNNYGQLIWETAKLDSKGAPVEGWDGTYKGAPAPQGTYLWQASATFINGSLWRGMSYNNAPPQRTGTVNLIR